MCETSLSLRIHSVLLLTSEIADMWTIEKDWTCSTSAVSESAVSANRMACEASSLSNLSFWGPASCDWPALDRTACPNSIPLDAHFKHTSWKL
jgi:hypothetical protein